MARLDNEFRLIDLNRVSIPLSESHGTCPANALIGPPRATVLRQLKLDVSA